jgi:hypothetical protein
MASAAKQAIDLIGQYDGAVDRFTRTVLSHGHGSPEAAAMYAKYVERREALIALVSFGLTARTHSARPVVDV